MGFQPLRENILPLCVVGNKSECSLAPPTFKSKKTLGDKAFQVAAPTLWNKLPSALRMETSLKPFKAKLKTLLFKEACDLKFYDS